MFHTLTAKHRTRFETGKILRQRESERHLEGYKLKHCTNIHFNIMNERTQTFNIKPTELKKKTKQKDIITLSLLYIDVRVCVCVGITSIGITAAVVLNIQLKDLRITMRPLAGITLVGSLFQDAEKAVHLLGPVKNFIQMSKMETVQRV